LFTEDGWKEAGTEDKRKYKGNYSRHRLRLPITDGYRMGV